MSFTYELLGGKVSFHEQVREYGLVKKNFNVYYDRLEETVVNFYRANVRYVMAMYATEDQKYDYTSRLLAEICKEMSAIITDVLNVVEEKGIKGKTREDYANDNQGLNQLYEISNIAFAAKVDLWNHGSKMATKRISGNAYEAVHVIQKNAYGHRVSPVGEALLKEMEENYDKWEAAKPVLKKTSAAGKVISRMADDWFDARWFEHFILYSENVLTIIYNIMDGVVERVMKDCVEAGLFPAEVVNNVDQKRSNELLQTVEEAEDKAQILRQALEADPSNQNVYAAALRLQCLDDGVLACARDFDQGQQFLDVFLQEVDALLHDVERDEEVVAQKIHDIAILQDKEEVDVYRSLYGDTIQEMIDAYTEVKGAIAESKQLDQWLKAHIDESVAQVLQYSDRELDNKIYAYVDGIVSSGLYKEMTEKGLLLPEQIRLEGSTETNRKFINEEIMEAMQKPLAEYMEESRKLWQEYADAKAALDKEVEIRKAEIDDLKYELSKMGGLFSFKRNRKVEVSRQIREKEHRLSMYRVANDPKALLEKLENRFSE